MGAGELFSGTARFEVLRTLGSGGMGAVYEVRDRDHDTRVALKTLLRADASALYRFKQEFRTLQGIEHPNLVKLGELIEDDGRWFYTMELVAGVDLLCYVSPSAAASQRDTGISPSEDTLRSEAVVGYGPTGLRHSFDEVRLRAAFGQLALAVHALHEAQLIHRDIKPSNALVTEAGRVVLLDFGLVSKLDERLRAKSASLVGTAEYMAPEQALSAPMGPSGDWYSVGVMLYEALTGRLPHGGRTAIECLMQKQRFTPPPPRAHAPDTPPDLEELCVALLARKPEDRPTEAEVLDRLAVADVHREAPRARSTASRFTQTTPFVGRQDELARLRRAFAESQAGNAVTVVIEGDSGIGKSVLARKFIEDLREEEPRLIDLWSQCYERESVPYKAFDGVADALSQVLTKMDDADAAYFVPRTPALALQLFPVLRRVKALTAAPQRVPQLEDVQEMRRRKLDSFRELLFRLSERKPVVVAIDDFQWAGADSLVLLTELLQPDDAPPMLLLIIARTGMTGTVRDTLERLGSRSIHLKLSGLSHEVAAELIALVTRSAADELEQLLEIVTREAEGHPLFIVEMARHFREMGTAEEGMRLDDAIWTRIAALAPMERRLLEILAIAGRPLLFDVAAGALDQGFEAFERAASVLRVAFLARTAMSKQANSIEPYHDRVRETVLARLDAETTRNHHREIALALQQSNNAPDPQVLVRHLEAAGDDERAAELAETAARHAVQASAFERGTSFFETALRLGRHPAQRALALRLELADALTNAGQCARAASVLVEASEDADPATRLDCQRRAAEQLLISGHIDEGLQLMGNAVAHFGVRIQVSRRRAIASLLLHRALLRLRGLGWKERHPKEIAEDNLIRLDTFRATSQSLGMVDPVRGADFQCRTLMLALKAGDNLRIAKALTVETTLVAAAGGRSLKRARRLADLTAKTAGKTGEPGDLSWPCAADGFVNYFSGNFATAAERFAEAYETVSTHIPGTASERNILRVFHVLALRHGGRIAELRARYNDYLRDAERRGDHYLETTLLRCAGLVFLSRADPDECQRALDASTWRALGDWYTLQDWYELEANAELSLYRGTADTAMPEIERGLEVFSRSLLTRVQIVRAIQRWLRARLILATSHDVDQSNRTALKLVRELRRERIAYATVWADLVEATVRARGGDKDAAARLLEEAIEHAGDNLQLAAATAKYARGRLLNGAAGDRWTREADAWFASQDVHKPQKLLRIVLSGFPGL